VRLEHRSTENAAHDEIAYEYILKTASEKLCPLKLPHAML
jgi:hypothetical protein